jgi:hypothetical protein
MVLGCSLALLAACEEPRPTTVEVRTVPKTQEDPKHPCPPGATQIRRESNGVVTFSCEDGKKSEDPRLPCPTGTTQKRFESKVVPGAVDLWCEDNENELTQGLRREWYPNGQLAKETPYRDGKPEGLVRTWYMDGAREHEAMHRNGKLDGLDRDWHPNGKLKSEIRFEMDRAVGIGKFWDERGRLVKTRNYAKDPLPIPDTEPFFPSLQGRLQNPDR